MLDPATVDVGPVTAERWPALETLFGERGACAGCWCMYWRKPHAAFEAEKGDANRRDLKQLVESGAEPGLLATVDGDPAGWCSVAPRDDFPRLANSRILAPVDDEAVWSVVCFFVAKPYRGQGLSVRLLDAAKEYVRERGGTTLEGYPVDPKSGDLSPAFAWVGLASAFERAGFEEVERRSETRPIMRCSVSTD